MVNKIRQKKVKRVDLSDAIASASSVILAYERYRKAKSPRHRYEHGGVLLRSIDDLRKRFPKYVVDAIGRAQEIDLNDTYRAIERYRHEYAEGNGFRI